MSQLRATSDKILVEGIGLDAENAERTLQEKWPGMNLLGQVLMSVRRELGDCNFTVKVDAGNVQQGEEVVCRQIEEWLQGCCPSAGAPHFCDKGALQVELSAAQQNLKKSERRKLSAEFETRRQVMEARMKELAAISLPTIFGSFFSIFSRLKPLLKNIETAYRQEREAISSLTIETRKERCHIFYDGTADCTYSNFQQFRFAVGSIGFMKGEQFFHVAKALLCKDLPTALQMMITTGGPPLRRLGHEVSNYAEFGAEWEDVDSGLVLFVNTVIKLAALQPCFSAANDILHQEFK